MSEGTPTPDGHYVKRVVLPSGKTIEVVYFDDDREAAPAPRALHPASAAPSRIPTELHICPECRSGLVYPTEWDEAGPEYWRVALRCPNCEWFTSGIFPQDTVDVFDERLDQGTEQMVGDLRRLMQANMNEEIDRFVAALDDDQLLPEDF